MKQIGDQVTYVDPRGVEHEALVTASFNDPTKKESSVNVVYVSGDEGETDQYGRQIKRDTSVPHEGDQAAPGRYWK